MPINESSCVSCGHCSTVCPCNAMMEKGMEGEAGYLTGINNETVATDDRDHERRRDRLRLDSRDF
nr:4Fe-4S binding protein [Bacillus subtilis]